MNRSTIGLLTAILGIVLVSGLSWLNIFQARSQLNQEQAQLDQARTTLLEQKAAFEQEQTKYREETLSRDLSESWGGVPAQWVLHPNFRTTLRYRETMKSWFGQGLQTTSISPTIKAKAQTITLETLQQLDGEGKGAILKFLYQENLIGQL